MQLLVFVTILYCHSMQNQLVNNTSIGGGTVHCESYSNASSVDDCAFVVGGGAIVSYNHCYVLINLYNHN